VKRLLAIGLFALGFVVAGVFSGAVIADVTTSTTTSTAPATTTVETTPVLTTTTAPTTTTTTTTVTAPSTAGTIPAGVRIAGVRVGGLKPADAVSSVQLAFQRPLAVVVDRTRLELDPVKFAAAYAATAVARARIAAPGTNVSLVVAVRGAPLHAWVAKIEHRFNRAAVDATLTFPGARPRIRDDRSGRKLNAASLTQRIVATLRANSRLPVRVRTQTIAPHVTADSFQESIVINRSANRLYLYDGAKVKRTFAVATGQSIYPTPRGLWHIVVMWKNPWWYPPVQDSWAKGLKPVPPGPSNPLGTRWMGLNAPGVGIHGTDEPGSIGYSASHGCIRMQVPDAEWLFNQVDVGTTVYIV
jgi:lipoprotein-anchoring transpeptidase ErfK/SrfK